MSLNPWDSYDGNGRPLKQTPVNYPTPEPAGRVEVVELPAVERFCAFCGNALALTSRDSGKVVECDTAIWMVSWIR